VVFTGSMREVVMLVGGGLINREIAVASVLGAHIEGTP
jgi:hypothetical protein